MGILRTRLSEVFLDVKLRLLFSAPRPLSLIHSSFCRRRRGQNTVEYLLMLAVVAGLTLTLAVLFHKRILGGMFSIVGMATGAGKPAPP